VCDLGGGICDLEGPSVTWGGGICDLGGATSVTWGGGICDLEGPSVTRHMTWRGHAVTWGICDLKGPSVTWGGVCDWRAHL